MYVCMYVHIHECVLYAHIHICMTLSCVFTWVDQWMNGWMDEQVDGSNNLCVYTNILYACT